MSVCLLGCHAFSYTEIYEVNSFFYFCRVLGNVFSPPGDDLFQRYSLSNVAEFITEQVRTFK